MKEGNGTKNNLIISFFHSVYILHINIYIYIYILYMNKIIFYIYIWISYIELLDNFIILSKHIRKNCNKIEDRARAFFPKNS